MQEWIDLQISYLLSYGASFTFTIIAGVMVVGTEVTQSAVFAAVGTTAVFLGLLSLAHAHALNKSGYVRRGLEWVFGEYSQPPIQEWNGQTVIADGGEAE